MLTSTHAGQQAKHDADGTPSSNKNKQCMISRAAAVIYYQSKLVMTLVGLRDGSHKAVEDASGRLVGYCAPCHE